MASSKGVSVNMHSYNYVANILFVSYCILDGNHNIKSFCYFSDKFPLLVEMFHSLDIWHKAKKLTKALHQVITHMAVEKRKTSLSALNTTEVTQLSEKNVHVMILVRVFRGKTGLK